MNVASGPVEPLIAAWVKWDHAPSSHRRVVAKEKALHALGLNTNQAHDHIAAWRRAGYSIPDAIQSLMSEPHHEEAA